jgi:hypothetical protein
MLLMLDWTLVGNDKEGEREGLFLSFHGFSLTFVRCFFYFIFLRLKNGRPTAKYDQVLRCRSFSRLSL